MVGHTGFILDYSYRKYTVHCVKEGIAAGSPVVREAESSHFIYIQGAEMKNKKWGQTIKPEIPPLVRYFLPQSSACHKFYNLPNNLEKKYANDEPV